MRRKRDRIRIEVWGDYGEVGDSSGGLSSLVRPSASLRSRLLEARGRRRKKKE